MSMLFYLGIMLLGGLLFGRLAKKVGLPNVTGYLVAGLIVGPYVLKIIPADAASSISMVSEMALGFIALSIGAEFKLSYFREVGVRPVVIAILEGLCAMGAVVCGLLFAGQTLAFSLVLGAIASATAPAATIMVIRQYNANGPLTKTLLSVVALDDAVGLIAFAVSFGIARAMDSAQFSLASILLSPLIEIVGSLLLGALAGFVLTKLETMFRSNSNRLSLSIAFIFLMVGLSAMDFTVAGADCGFSPLLVCMMLGTVFCNICPLSDDLMERADRWSTPMLAVFFVISGANLRLSVFSQGVLVFIGVVYIIARSAGKYCGARWSAKAVGCDHTVQKYLGIMLLPQEGVALGMCVSAQALGADGELIRNIILFSVLIYELVGPVATKESLKAAGAITEKPKEVLERRERKLAEAEPKELLERHKERANKK